MRYSIQRKSSAILCLGLAITSAVSSSISSAFSFSNFSFSDLTNTASKYTQKTKKFLSSSIEKMYNFLSSKPSKEEATRETKEKNETKETNESVKSADGETNGNIGTTLYNIVDKVGIFAFLVLVKVAAGAYNAAKTFDNIVTEFVEQNNNDTNKEKTKNIKGENTNSSKQNEGETEDKGAETQGNNIAVKESKDNLKNEETSSVVKNGSNLKGTEIKGKHSKNTELVLAKNAGNLEKLGKKEDSDDKEITTTENSQQVNSWAYDALSIFNKLNMLELNEKNFEDLEKVFDVSLFDGDQNFEPIDFRNLYIKEGFNKGSNIEELKDDLKGKKIVFSEKTDVKNKLGEGQAANIIENMLTDGNNSTELVTKSNANNFKNLGTNSENSNSTEIALNKTPELKNVYGYDALSFFNRLKTEGLGKTSLNNFDFSLHEYGNQNFVPIKLNDLFIKYKNEGEEAFKDYLKGKEIVISEKTDNKNKLVEGQTINNKNMLTDENVANEAENVSNKKDTGIIAQNTKTNKEGEKEEKITENKVENSGQNNNKDEEKININTNDINLENNVNTNNNISNENTNVNQKTNVENEGKNNIDQNSNEKIDNKEDLNKKEEINNENIVTNNIKENNKNTNVVENTDESNENGNSKINEEKNENINNNKSDSMNDKILQNEIETNNLNLGIDNVTEEINQTESQEGEKTNKKKKIIKRKKSKDSAMKSILNKFDKSKDLKKQLVNRATILVKKLRARYIINGENLAKQIDENLNSLNETVGNKNNNTDSGKENLSKSLKNITKILENLKDLKENQNDTFENIYSSFKDLTDSISKEKGDSPESYIKFYVSVRNTLREEKPYLNESEFAEKLKEKFGENFSGESNSQT